MEEEEVSQCMISRPYLGNSLLVLPNGTQYMRNRR
jgi:hypothetical protein